MKTSHHWGEGTPGTSWMVPAILDLVCKSGASKVLDVGCGNGFLCRQLVDQGYEVSGVDGGQRAIDVARQKVPEARLDVVRFADDPPATGFDAVTSIEVIEHLYDPAEMLEYCRKALKPGGTLILSTPYHGYWKNLAMALAGMWDKHHRVDFVCGHIKFFSRWTLQEMLVATGFRMTGFKGLGRIPYLWKSMLVVAVKSGD